MSAESTVYDFSEDFQVKILACAYRSHEFAKQTAGLIKPEYFEREVHSAIAMALNEFFAKFRAIPSQSSLIQVLLDFGRAKIIRRELIKEAHRCINEELKKESIGDYEFVATKVAEFARHKAMEIAALECVDLIEAGKYEKAAKLMSDASQVGLSEEGKSYEYFGEEEINLREHKRNERLAGVKTKAVIPTGVTALDGVLFHGGWGRGEFYTMMGPPKSGKSISLAFFAMNAIFEGYNVLFVTLEVSDDITAERMDSYLTGIPMSDLKNHIIAAKEKTIEKSKKAEFGRLFIEERPTGTLTPNGLHRIIDNHKRQGRVFDMIVVDYADIMAPNVRTADPIENSKSVYVALRALAQIENVALLSATQTNREGAKVVTAKAEHAAEDFNRIRIPDLVISINATDDEKARGEARLYMAASRNQEDGFALHITRNLACMKFVESVRKIE